MASSRFRFVTLRAHQLAQSVAAPQTQTASRPVKTLAARPVAAIADRFEPGASRRILVRRPSSPSAADTHTGPTASTTTTCPASTATPSSEPAALQTVHPTPRKSEVASHTKAFESDQRWLGQCAAARERREQLSARHAQVTMTRWQSAIQGTNQSTARGEANHATCTPMSVISSATETIAAATTSISPSAYSSTSSSPTPGSDSSSGAHSSDTPAPVDRPSDHSSTTVAVQSRAKDYPANSKWLTQRAEGRERRQQLAARC
jgi:hypothetical protein